MRLLHVDTGRELRGGQRQVLLLLEGLRALGEDCVLLARAASPLFERAAQAGFPVFPAAGANLLLRSRQADLIHAHDARAHTLAALAARAPFVVSRRVAFPVRRSLISRWKYRRAARFLAVSRFVAAELERAGIGPDKIDLVYDGVDPALQPAAWRADLPAVALASDDPAKGRDLMAQASQLAGIPVVYSHDLAADLARASMFVYLTRAEGLGSAALLAMAMGVPVVASDVGGLPEALGFGAAGLLVPNRPPEIAAAMRRLREDSTLAPTLIQQGQKRVAEHFTTETMVRRTVESYRRALAV